MRVRESVAANRCTSEEVLYILASDRERMVRSAVAQNPGSGAAVLDLLARDTEVLVRFYVAQRDVLAPELCKQLAGDADSLVRHAAACNRSARFGVKSDRVQDCVMDESEDEAERQVAGLGC